MTTLTAAQSVPFLPGLRLRRLVFQGVAYLGLVGLTAWSAVLAKEARSIPPLVQVELQAPTPDAGVDAPAENLGNLAGVPVDAQPAEPEGGGAAPASTEADEPSVRCADTGRRLDPERLYPPGTRFFNGRPIRPARNIWMTVTAYSPDHRSCGDSADGITATLHSVHTNGHRLVAADPRVLRYGSMITVPGYDQGRVVPVLDCGGKIKGNRLDVLFPTHEQARRWGVKRLRVTVWEYADGKPAENPRKVR